VAHRVALRRFGDHPWADRMPPKQVQMTRRQQRRCDVSTRM
jgi:hypothetical protein